MKYKEVRCDICGKDITTDFQYKFRYWHHRVGTFHRRHMCQECFDKFKEFVKESEGQKEV